MTKKTIKSVIAPIQKWLLKKGFCVGCGSPLGKASKVKHKEGFKVICKCRRIYIKNNKGGYRRALIKEI